MALVLQSPNLRTPGWSQNRMLVICFAVGFHFYELPQPQTILYTICSRNCGRAVLWNLSGALHVQQYERRVSVDDETGLPCKYLDICYGVLKTLLSCNVLVTKVVQVVSFLSESFIFCYIGVSIFVSGNQKWNLAFLLFAVVRFFPSLFL